MIGLGGISYWGRRAGAVMDGPATAWSPYFKGGAVSLSGSNLIATSSSTGQVVYSTDYKSSGKYYFEITLGGTGSTVAHAIGILTCYGAADGNIPRIIPPSYGANGYGAYIYGDTGNVYVDGSGSASTTLATYSSGDVIGVQVDIGAGSIKFRKNGGSWSSSVSITASKFYCPWIAINNTTQTFTANFGGSAWHTNPDIGYVGWSTTSAKTGRYWKYAKLNGSDPMSAIREIELRLTSGGSDTLSGGTATAHNSFDASTTADKAVDNNTATYWNNTYGSAHPHWWKYDYGSGNSKANVEATIQMRSDSALGNPSELVLLGSENNTDWFPAYGTSGLSWSLGETKTFTWG